MSMQLKYNIILLLSLVVLLTACRQDELPSLPTAGDEVELTAVIDESVNRASQTGDNRYAFDPGDTIQVVAWIGALEPVPADKWWINSLNTFNGRKWTATPYMRWQNGDGLQHHFRSWWPAQLASPTSDDLHHVSHSVTETYNPDILVARTSLARPADNRLSLHFTHLLSRFDVRLRFIEHFTGISDITVAAHVALGAELDLMEGTVQCGTTRGALALSEVVAGNGVYWSGTQIIIPQECADCVITLAFMANGTEHQLQYVHPSLLFESGKRTTLTLLVSKEEIKVVSASVTPWIESPSLGDTDAEETI